MKIFTLLFVFLAAACGTSALDDTSDYSLEELYEVPATNQPPSPGASLQVAKTARSSVDIQKKEIKTGSLTYRVDSNNEEYQRIIALLDQFEAYIASENEYKGGDRVNFNLSVKVSPQHFDALIAAIAEKHTLENRYVNTSDVTERYYDLESRIGNKQELESRYLEILKEARTVSDLLEVERNLNQVRTEIESLQGQFKMLNHQIDYSSLDISFYEILPYQVVEDQRPGFGKRLINALSGGWGILLSVVVGLVQLWPFVFLGLFGWWLVRKIRNRKKTSS